MTRSVVQVHISPPFLLLKLVLLLLLIYNSAYDWNLDWLNSVTNNNFKKP